MKLILKVNCWRVERLVKGELESLFLLPFKLDDPVLIQSVLNCLLGRHPYITESFSRSNNGRAWTVFSRSKHQTSTSSTSLKTNENLSSSHLSSPSVTSETYLLVAGSKPTSMNDADHELRRLARDFPSFGL